MASTDATLSAELQTELQQLIRQHVFAPMALGAKASSYENKLVAVLQCLGLDVGESLLSLCSGAVSWTTDLGTEHLLCQTMSSAWDFVQKEVLSVEPGLKYQDDDEELSHVPAPPVSVSHRLFHEAIPAPS